MPTQPVELEVLLEVALGSPVRQLRAAPVALGPGAPRAFLAAYCADFDDDPYVEMFFFPSDTLKLALVTAEGAVLWRRDLGRAVVPGAWFCPVFPFDLDGDGTDEIWFVNNTNADHPLGLSGYRLERLDARTGATTGQWPWPAVPRQQPMSHLFRNFILGGYAKDEPVLVTAQGTYGEMALQAWRPDMSARWAFRVGRDAPGARGSHMCAVADLDKDGVQEVLWGERCIELDTGRELFCGDRDSYRAHSDVAQPVHDRASGRRFVYTCREGAPQTAPRVALFDARGERVWGRVDEGHMDMGWAARIGPGGALLAMAVRIGGKSCGREGRFRRGCEEFVFDALSGEERTLPFSVYGTLPVDINGDGRHELVRGGTDQHGELIDGDGNTLGSVGAPVAMAAKFLDRPGEQILTYHPDGTLRVWADRRAVDSPDAAARYADPLYAANRRLSAVGYNLVNLGAL
ncbi:MAG: polysaccharide lyase 11 [Kiritimatiellae bacterium]|nr:polysaccharide lyase 11 [Kiritimatiellia bacterium]